MAGKTGTAQKAEPGRGYLADEFVASFVGFAPAARPVLVGVVVLDDPRGSYHGGEAAAPVFGAIARQALLYLDVAPRARAAASAGRASRDEPDGGAAGAPLTAALVAEVEPRRDRARRGTLPRSAGPHGASTGGRRTLAGLERAPVAGAETAWS